MKWLFCCLNKQAPSALPDPELCTLEACEPCPTLPAIASPIQHGGPLTFPQTVSISCELIQVPQPQKISAKKTTQIGLIYSKLTVLVHVILWIRSDSCRKSLQIRDFLRLRQFCVTVCSKTFLLSSYHVKFDTTYTEFEVLRLNKLQSIDGAQTSWRTDGMLHKGE